MCWKNIKDEVPIWYQVVKAVLKNGEEVLLWRASNGDYDFYTKYNSNEVFFEDDIEKWKDISEEDIPKWEEI